MSEFDLKKLYDDDGRREWRLKEAEELSNLIQRRFHILQNPDNCFTAKKLVCDLYKVQSMKQN